MKKIGYPCILSLLFFNLCFLKYGYSQWQDVSSDRYDISFADNKGIMVGENGSLMISIDSGATWNNVDVGISGKYWIDHLFLSEDGQQIKLFANTNMREAGYATPASLFRHSKDRGNTWQTTFSENYKNNCYFINNDIGWIYGRKVLKTTDGGNTWVEQPFLQNLKNISFYDQIHGWATISTYDWPYYTSHLYKTSDGGISWVQAHQIDQELPDVALISKNLYVFDSSFAWIGVGGGYKTMDGGKTWNSVSNDGQLTDFNGNIDALLFKDSLNGYMIGDNRKSVYRTFNGGKTWNSVLKSKDEYLQLFNKIYFVDEDNGYVLGTNGFTASTRDGGTTWQEENYCPAGNNYGLSEIQISDQRTWLVTSTDVYHSSHDFGDWKSFSYSQASEGFSDVYNIDSNAVLIGGGYWTSQDLGETWKKQTISINGTGRFSWENANLYLRNPQVMWLSLINNNVLKSTDGGKVFHSKTPYMPSFGGFRQFKLAFQSDSIIWAYDDGNSKSSFKTTNGGNSWSETIEKPISVFFLTKSIGWKLLKTGEFYKTVDGAITWQLQDRLSFIMFASKPTVYFVDENAGWILDNGFNIYKTINGGQDWELDYSSYSFKLSLLKFHVNPDGTVLGYTGGKRLLKYMGKYSVTKSHQSITFKPIPKQEYENFEYALNATASSGLEVSYESSNADVATVTGNIVNIIAPGTSVITATQKGNRISEPAEPVSQVLTVNKSSQQIVFDPITETQFGKVSQISLDAVASSGLPVTYKSSNTDVATISGQTVTIHALGTSDITASQIGNSNYFSAEPITQELVVSNRSPQSITFNPIPEQQFGESNEFLLNATSTSGLIITYYSSNTDVATVSGNKLTILSGGTSTITAFQGGNANFSPAESITRTLLVSKSPQSIIFESISEKEFGKDKQFILGATATSGLDVAYQSSYAAVATISGNVLTIHAPGTISIKATQVGNNSYYSAEPILQTLVVKKSFQSIIFAPISEKEMGKDKQFLFEGYSTSGRPLTYESSNNSVATIAGNIVTIHAAGTTEIKATQNGNRFFMEAEPVFQTLVVNKSTQSISFSPVGEKQFGVDKEFILDAAATSGLDVTYASSNTDVATVYANNVTIIAPGITDITAFQNGDDNFNAAEPLTHPLVVNKSSQTISFYPINDKQFGEDNQFTLNAIATSGLAINYESSDNSVATITGDIVTIIGAGTSKITAHQDGNYIYTEAESISHDLMVKKSPQSISFSPLPEWYFVDRQQFSLGATSTSDLDVTYSSSNSSVATITGDLVTLLSPGTADITAYQDGNSNYTAAEPLTRTLKVNTITALESYKAMENNIYPNPATDEVKIILNSFTLRNIVLITFYDMRGRIVQILERKLENPLELNVEGLASGIYRINIVQDNLMINLSFIKI